MNEAEIRSEVAEIDLKIQELKKRRKELLAALGEGRLSWGMIVVGVFGALMIGLGVIALFAANWDVFGREARAAIALAPVVACGAAATWGHAKGVKARALWEPLGVLWCISVGAAACLVAQTYQVGGSVPALVLFVALLMLPVLWVTCAAAPIALWPVMAIVWVYVKKNADGYGSESVALACEGAALMALSLPAYVAFLRSRPPRAALLSVQVTTGLVYSLGLGILLCGALPLGYRDEAWGVCIFWLCAALVAGVGRAFSLPAWGTIGAVVAAAAVLPTPFFREGAWAFLVALVVAGGIIAYGVAKLRIGFANIGAAAFLWLVLAKFFQSDLPFMFKGCVLIACGVALTALNVVLVCVRRERRAAK